MEEFLKECFFRNQGSENWGKKKTIEIADVSRCSFVQNIENVSVRIKEDFRETNSAKFPDTDTDTEQISSRKSRSRRFSAELGSVSQFVGRSKQRGFEESIHFPFFLVTSFKYLVLNFLPREIQQAPHVR